MLNVIRKLLDGKANTSHAHAAADITSGTIATARLGSGTANSSSFLRGDQTWAAPPAGAKAWVAFTGSTGVILASSGVSSVARSAAGRYVVNFSSAFANANYVGVVTVHDEMASSYIAQQSTASTAAKTTTAFPISCAVSAGTSFSDPTTVYAVFFGD